jgi:mRNA interferase RelE/StbE
VPRSELSARVGDYRLICKIEDDRLLVLVLRISHRKEIYR